MKTSGTVLVATDLTDDSRAALVRGSGHARAIGARLIVCHIVPDVMRHHPLSSTRGENDVVLGADLTRRAADLLTEQVGSVLKLSSDDYQAVVETGSPHEEIVRIGETENVSLIAIGGRARPTGELGHVAERVIRYSHASVLVARESPGSKKILVPTDFGEGALPALRVAKELITTMAVEATLLHVMELPSSAVANALSPLGIGWIPPSAAALEQLETLGKTTLDGLAKEYGFAHAEQIEGDPAAVITRRARELGVEMIVTGSRGRTGLARLVLGSVAERVTRAATCSVLVAR